MRTYSLLAAFAATLALTSPSFTTLTRAHGAEAGEAEFAFRSLFEVEANTAHQLVVMHLEDHVEGHVIFAMADGCHESQLAAVDVEEMEERELDELEPSGQLVPTSPLGGFTFETDHMGAYMFQLNLSSPCWMLLHSSASQVFVIESSSGEQVSPLYQLEMKPEVVRNNSSVNGQAAAAVLIVCCLPIMLVAIFYLGVSTVSAFINFGHAALFMQSFGCGALLAVSTLHIYPEMVISLEHSGVPQWQGGALMLGAICVMMLIQFVASMFHDHNHMKHANHETDAPVDDEEEAKKAADPENQQTPPPTATAITDPATASAAVASTDDDLVKKPAHAHSHSHAHSHAHSHGHSHAAMSEHPAPPKRIVLGTVCGIFDMKTVPSVVWGLTIGDTIHNLVDGAAIASAFMTCGTTSGWIVTAAIIAHELPQELGDLVIMVAQGSTLLQACFFNFVAQLSALIGMGIVISIGDMGEQDAALLLAFGLGTFFMIALTQIAPRLLQVRTKAQALVVAAGLSIAMVVIGLTQLADKGCSAQ